MTQRQATEGQLLSLNRLRVSKGYEPIHPDDWPGVTWGRAEALIADMRSRSVAR